MNTISNKDKFNIAFVGTPNVGKSSLLNLISKKYIFQVGNWSGVTVEKKQTLIKFKEKNFFCTDLPGIYSLNPNSKDAKIAINEIIKNNYDLFVQVIDGTDLNSGLYLTMLLKELNLPLIVLINFNDKIEKHKIQIDIKKLKLILRCNILLVSAINSQDNSKILSSFSDYFNNKTNTLDNKEKKELLNFYLYTKKLNNFKNNLINSFLETDLLEKFSVTSPKLFNFYISGVLEQNNYAYEIIPDNISKEIINETITNEINNYSINEISDEIVISRQNYINNLLKSCTSKIDTTSDRLKATIKIDKFILNKWFSLPIFSLLLFIIFILVFNFATPYKNLLSDIFTIYLPNLFHLSNNKWYGNFINNGIFGSLGTLLSFIPIMYLLFIVISILQQSGLINRFSFSLNKIFNAIGLEGKSIIPFILGFGCNVASIFSTRTIENEKQRKATAMLSPFMSCSARLVVFSLFAATFFSASAGLIVFSLYFLGIVAAIFIGLIIKWLTGYKNSNNDLNLMDLPAYQMPSLKIIFKAANLGLKTYVKRAATVIVGFTFVVWTLSYFPHGANHINSSLLSQLKYVLNPIFKPLGFGNSWILAVAIIPGIVAKETTVATLALLYGINAHADVSSFGSDILNSIKNSFILLLPNHWFNSTVFDISHQNTLGLKIKSNIMTFSSNPNLVAYSYMTFILLTIPCITTLGALKQEFGWKIMSQSLLLGLITPYLFSLLIFQLGYFFIKIIN